MNLCCSSRPFGALLFIIDRENSFYRLFEILSILFVDVITNCVDMLTVLYILWVFCGFDLYFNLHCLFFCYFPICIRIYIFIFIGNVRLFLCPTVNSIVRSNFSGGMTKKQQQYLLYFTFVYCSFDTVNGCSIDFHLDVSSLWWFLKKKKKWKRIQLKRRK